jgi:hypothetical protein
VQEVNEEYEKARPVKGGGRKRGKEDLSHFQQSDEDNMRQQELCTVWQRI